VGAGGARQGGVFEDEVDAGGDGFVEDGDAVGGEEEDALEEFELAEEDWCESCVNNGSLVFWDWEG